MRNWEKFNAGVVEEFRANGGKVKGKGPLLLLTTIGARTGLPRVTPLVYTVNGDDIVIIASKAGEPTNPDWYHNLVAHPDVTVELGSDQFPAKARVTEGEEHDRLYAAMAKVMYRFAKYQQKTERTIPLIVLERLPRTSRPRFPQTIVRLS
jgi:deazaflavin-dependent oxidoreductase (nitroreductase family)